MGFKRYNLRNESTRRKGEKETEEILETVMTDSSSKSMFNIKTQNEETKRSTSRVN